VVSLIQKDDGVYFLSQGQHLQELTDFTAELTTYVPPNIASGCGIRAWEYWGALRRIKFEPTDNVIDIGAQPSFVDAWVAKRVHSVLAIDSKQFENRGPNIIRPEFEEWTRLLTAVAPNISTKIVDGRSTGLADNSFDAALSFSVLEHLEPGQDSLASEEAYRILKPGGFFAGTIDYGRPEDGVPFCELYDWPEFKKRIATVAPWKWVAEAPYNVPEPKSRSVMVFVLQK